MLPAFFTRGAPAARGRRGEIAGDDTLNLLPAARRPGLMPRFLKVHKIGQASGHGYDGRPANGVGSSATAAECSGRALVEVSRATQLAAESRRLHAPRRLSGPARRCGAIRPGATTSGDCARQHDAGDASPMSVMRRPSMKEDVGFPTPRERRLFHIRSGGGAATSCPASPVTLRYWFVRSLPLRDHLIQQAPRATRFTIEVPLRAPACRPLFRTSMRFHGPASIRSSRYLCYSQYCAC